MSDRSAELLSELQTVCQRILASDARVPGETAAITTMASVANGAAVADSLEALRRQCADNNQEMAELRRSIDTMRGVLASHGSPDATMLADLGRSIASLVESVERERNESLAQRSELLRSVEALRVGLAGFSASNRQQVSALRGSVESLEASVTGLDERVEASVTGLDERVEANVTNLAQRVEASVTGLDERVETNVTSLAQRVEASVTGLDERVETNVTSLGQQVEANVTGLGERVQVALNALGGQIQSAFATLSEQITLVLEASREQVGEEMRRQTIAYEALLSELTPTLTRDRLDELETMLSVGLPQFSEEIQAGVQQTLTEVSRTFQMAEREHGNRMGELHRDFDMTIRRLESTLQARRREQSVN